MSQTKDTIKSLRKQNDDLKNEIDTLRDKFRKFEHSVASKGNSHDAQKCQTPSVETQKSLDYLGNEYDDLNRFSETAKQQILRLESRLAEIADKVELVSNSIDEAQEYSYSYNVKVVGIPHLESARDTSDLCIKIFHEMGVALSIQDIDIVHRFNLPFYGVYSAQFHSLVN
jgi:predicted  nucleic acid-binding Zn-ribbon protein